MNRVVRLLHREARLDALKMVVPIMFPNAKRRITLFYFALDVPFWERGEFEANTLLVSAFNQDLAVIGLARLKDLVGRKRNIEKNRLARRQISSGRRDRH